MIALKQIQGNSGIDVWTKNLCRGLNHQGHTCSLDLRPWYFQFMPGLLKFQKCSDKYDIIQSNTWSGYVFKDSHPLVITAHHFVNDPAYNPFRTIPQKIFHLWIYRCERKSLEVADSVICVSQFTQKKLEEVFGYTGSQVIYNGIDTSVFRPIEQNSDAWNIPPDKNVLFFAGNLSRRKGADLLPAIMKMLGEDYVLLLATGQREISFGTLNNIKNIGHLDLAHLVMAYNRCDIFLSASRLEGFGLSVAEAMACGKPVVATNGSSLPELVVDGKGGFLCELDNVKDFVERIRYLAENDMERKTMGTFNRQRVIENFETGTMTKAYISLYNEILTNQ
jgi:glycosyltransferase involved in cell wall biosynthesis